MSVPKPTTASSAKPNLADPQTPGEALARQMLNPALRHGFLVNEIAQPELQVRRRIKPEGPQPSAADVAFAAVHAFAPLAAGDTSSMALMLAAQAMSLDHMFTDLGRMATANLDRNLDAAERLMRLALKAAAGSRATIEALANLHRPTETAVPRVHVSGGQAIVAQEFHQHAKETGNGKSAEQPHATGAGRSAGMRRANKGGQALSGESSAWESPMPDARRQRQRRAEG